MLGLGGSANLNYQIYLRGHSKDFENWANKTGDPRWGFENVLKFFQKFENLSNDGHGDLSIIRRPDTELGKTFLRAATELGYSETDLNAGRYTNGIVEHSN